MKKELRRLKRLGLPAPLVSAPGPSKGWPVPTPPEGIPILWVEPTGTERYHRGYHCYACKAYTEENMPADMLGEYKRIGQPDGGWPEPRPTITCKCGATVEMNSAGLDTEYHAPSTGEVFERIRDLPAAAIWAQRRFRDDRELRNWISNRDAEGNPFPEPEEGKGRSCRLIERLHEDDGRVLICRLPDGHDWTIDSRCNNCTLPLDDVHWCWNRSGRPEDGTLDVRKGKPGQTTCAAGAGSIQTGSWHGFLQNGRVRL